MQKGVLQRQRSSLRSRRSTGPSCRPTGRESAQRLLHGPPTPVVPGQQMATELGGDLFAPRKRGVDRLAPLGQPPCVGLAAGVTFAQVLDQAGVP